MRREHVPDRLRAAGGTDLERRVLDAAAHEEPSREMIERMARAIGVPLTMLGGGGGTAAASGGATAKTAGGAAATASSHAPVWIAVSAVGLVVAGAVVGTSIWRSPSSKAPPTPAAAVAPAAVVASAGEQPASVAPAHAAPTTPPDGATQPPASTPAPFRRSRAAGMANELREEIALVDRARAAISEGAGDHALELLRKYQERYPAGSFRPEATSLRVEALVKLGREAEARALAERFVAEHGRSPLADRVARVAGLEHR